MVNFFKIYQIPLLESSFLLKICQFLVNSFGGVTFRQNVTCYTIYAFVQPLRRAPIREREANGACLADLANSRSELSASCTLFYPIYNLLLFSKLA